MKPYASHSTIHFLYDSRGRSIVLYFRPTSAQGGDNLFRLRHLPPERKHASAAMVVIVCDDTADLAENPLSYMNRQFSIATEEDGTQESNVRATTRRSSPVLAASYQTDVSDDMEEVNLAASASAPGAVTRFAPTVAGACRDTTSLGPSSFGDHVGGVITQSPSQMPSWRQL